jgi:DNA repair exonuclease SbcCD ATPase subunit
MRHATMGGVTGVYIEANYRGHKVSPGRYRLTLKLGARTASTEAEVLPHPLYTADAATYAEYDQFMTRAEGEVNRMHDAANELHEAQEQLAAILAKLPATPPFADLRRDAEALLGKLKAWDGDVVSRQSKAYDDVENFAQKFSANWMFMVNATESDLPRVNQPSKDRFAELEPEWQKLKSRAEALNDEIQALNRKLFDQGVGAIKKKKPAGPGKIG